jgi:hypothetical protein
VLVHALRIPRKKGLMEIHEKASAIFESCILKTNDLFLPSEITIEVGAVLSKIIPQELAREGIEKLLLTAEEIYPFGNDMALNFITRYPQISTSKPRWKTRSCLQGSKRARRTGMCPGGRTRRQK